MRKIGSSALLKGLFSISPYIGVVLGLYILKNAFLSIIIYHLGLITAIILFRKKISFGKISVVNNRPLLLVSVIACSLSGLLLYWLWDTVKLPTLNLSEVMATFGLVGPTKIVFLIYYSTIHPILEELYWRFILDPKDRFFSLSEFLFSTYHILVIGLFVKIEYVILIFLILLCVARIWRYFIQSKQERLLVLLTHTVADFSIMYCVIRLY